MGNSLDMGTDYQGRHAAGFGVLDRALIYGLSACKGADCQLHADNIPRAIFRATLPVTAAKRGRPEWC